MVAVDATTLLLLFRPDIPGPVDAKGNPVARVKDRIEYLVSQLDEAGTRILIPTPALSETLVRAGHAASQAIVDVLSRKAVFRVESFDTRAAVEVATMLRAELQATGKKAVKAGESWAKVKFDRQIVAIAVVNAATRIYSDDNGVRTLAQRYHIPVTTVAELPLPPEPAKASNLELFQLTSEE